MSSTAGCIHHLIEAQVERTPDAVAVVFGQQALSYRDLDRQANQLARHLLQLGVTLESRVAVLLERSIELEVALYGILKAGAAYVPIEPTDPPDRIAYFLADCEPTVVVTAERFRALVGAGDAAVVSVDAPDRPWSRLPTASPAVAVAPSNLCYVIYTSGSTGAPKGVMNEHGAVCNRLCWAREHLPLSTRDRVIQKTPYTFDVSVGELFGTLITGATLVMIPADAHRDPAWLSALIHDHAITAAHFVPSMLRPWLRDPGAAGCRSLRRILCSGEALTQDLVVQCLALLPVELHNLYGPTEAAVEVTHWACRSTDPGPMVVLGSALPNTRLYVVDDQLAQVPAGHTGELIIAGVQVARGYWKRAALTAERFLPDPFVSGERMYRTGDLARYRADGALEYLGRTDDQVKVRGVRVELGEIEAALRAHPGVRDCVCALRSDAGEPRLVAYWVPAGDHPVSVPALRAHLAATLPAYMVPASFVGLPELPRTASGKVDRRALPAALEDRAALETELVPPRNPAEVALCAIWCAVLGRHEIGIEDDFLALGGHSLLGAQITARIRESFGIALPLATVLRARTIAALAREIETSPNAPRRAAPIPKATERDGVPLSFEQRRVWFLDQVEGELSAFNICYAWRLRGDLDVEALRHAFEALVERHHVLRTVIVARDGEPYQAVQPNVRFDLVRDEVGSDVESIRAAERARTFALDRDPMLRARLVGVGEREHVLFVTVHHIASDGWSASVIWRELSALYGGRALPPLPIQYADYATWQRGSAIDPAALAYWKRALAGAQPLALPTDRPRPPRMSFRGAAVPVDIPARLAADLSRLATREGVTLQILFVAALQALLHHYTGQTDVAIAVPTAGRTHADLEPLVGFFIDILVIRGDLAGSPTLRDVLARTREASLQAYAHEGVPFASLVEALAAGRDPSRYPLVQVLAQVTYPGAELALAGLEVTREPVAPAHVGFDLQLDVVAAGAELRGHLVYGTDLFTDRTAAQLRDHLVAVLASIATSPETPVSSLALLSPAERTRILVDWNATTAPVPDGCVHTLFAEQAQRTPDAIAVTEATGARVRFADLETRANALARRLLALELGPEARVALAVDRSIAMVVGMLGILKAGAAYVPLDPSSPIARLAFVRADAGVAAIVVGGSRRGALAGGLADTHVVDLDAPTDPPTAAMAIPRGSPGDLFCVTYTSGSTGEPNGVELTHANVVNRLAWMWREVPFARGEVACQKTVLSFVDSIWEVFGPLLAGVPLVIIDEDVLLDPARLVAVLADAGVTRIVLVPSLLRVLLEVIPDLAQRLPRLRIWTSSGETLPYQLAAAFVRALPDGRLVNLYGSSEVTADVTCFVVTAATLCSPVPIGKPIANTQIYVLDRTRSPVPPRVTAEIYVGGAGVARGYHARPELTAERFVPNPFGPGRLFKTGDLGRYRDDGTLEYLGRNDRQIKIRGFRIELAEIEARLLSHPTVGRVAVVVDEDRPEDPNLVAYCVPRAPAVTLEVALLRAHLAATLPSYMLPASYVVLPTLPLMANGKLDRRALPPPSSPSASARGDDLETAVRGHFEAILARTGIGPREDFFRVGGHSLAAMRLVSRINKHHAANLAIRAFLDAPTIEGVVASLRPNPAPPPPAIAVTPESSLPTVAFSKRLVEIAAEHPLRVAILSSEGQLSYECLDRVTNRLAHRLVSLGWSPRVLTRVQRPLRRDAVIACVALLKLGATFELAGPGELGPHRPDTITLVGTARDVGTTDRAVCLDELIASSVSWWVDGWFVSDRARWESGRADLCPKREGTPSTIAFEGVTYARIDALASSRPVLDRPVRQPCAARTPLAFVERLAEGATLVLGHGDRRPGKIRSELESWFGSDSQHLYDVVREGDGPILVCVGDTITLVDLIRAATPQAEILWFKLDGIQLWPPRKSSLASHAAALASVLAWRSPKRPIVLVGFSGGGALAHAIATHLTALRARSAGLLEPLGRSSRRVVEVVRGAGAWRRRQDLVDAAPSPNNIQRWARWGHRLKDTIERHDWQPFAGRVAIAAGTHWHDTAGQRWFALWQGPTDAVIRPSEDHFSFFMNPALHAEWVAQLRRAVRAADAHADPQLVLVEPMPIPAR